MKNGFTNGGAVSKANGGVKTVGLDGELDMLPAKGEKTEKHSDSGEFLTDIDFLQFACIFT